MTVVDIMSSTEAAIAVDGRYVAHNYSPLPVVATSADGVWVTDVEGRRYLDCLAAYSAVNFGHRNPEITAVAHAQLDSLTLVSRAFHSDRLGPFCQSLAELCGKEMVLPMNSGAEAVESGIKVARKWGTDVKGVPAGQSNIVVAHNNFHGRTTTIISFSDDETARRGFGPYTPGSARWRSVTPMHWRPRSTRTPLPCCSSRSKVRPGSSFRPAIFCPGSGHCAPNATCS